MKKLVLSILLLPVLVFAAPVSPEDALVVAKGYRAYTEGETLDGELGVSIVEEPAVLKGEYDGKEIVLAYLFSYLPQGWILVSADDRTEPVVAFGAAGAPDFAADVGVDLVEHQHGDVVVPGGDRLEGEHHARQLAGGSDVGQRARRLPGVRLEAKLHSVASGGIRSPPDQIHAERRAQEAESVELARDRRRESGGRLAPCGG